MADYQELCGVVAESLFQSKWSALVYRGVPDDMKALLVSAASDALAAIEGAGYRVLRDEPDHFVTFHDNGWFIEHSLGCRAAGTIGTCEYNQAICEITADMPGADPELTGRWRITDVDDEGLPSLERVDD